MDGLLPDIKVNKLRAYELENLLQHETHDITCDNPAPHAGSGAGSVDPSFPFSNAVGSPTND